MRWAIPQLGQVPFGIAVFYRKRRYPDERELNTFAMVTGFFKP